ncbi:hypothetical protein Tco_1186086 [Tanacetum coccineum]
MYKLTCSNHGFHRFDSVTGQDNVEPTVPVTEPVEAEIPWPKRSKKERRLNLADPEVESAFSFDAVVFVVRRGKGARLEEIYVPEWNGDQGFEQNDWADVCQ